jgi:hypothetical protein|tara:strand:- start:121 stop:480 length:360 start_codon:yes stop_codon:yes gene_type:complete
MPSPYKLKNNPLDTGRILKIAKTLIDEAGEDRKLALESHKFFKAMVEEVQNSEEAGRPDSTAMNLMVECLKVAQNSKNNVIKIMGLVAKLEEAQKDTKTKASAKQVENVFKQLNELSND